MIYACENAITNGYCLQIYHGMVLKKIIILIDGRSRFQTKQSIVIKADYFTYNQTLLFWIVRK